MIVSNMVKHDPDLPVVACSGRRNPTVDPYPTGQTARPGDGFGWFYGTTVMQRLSVLEEAD
jgi:hypothetical protein